MIKVSVVIRSFNEAKYIGECIQQINRQFGDYEISIIVVDSESTDKTVQIAKGLGAVVVMIPKNDFSFGRALNIGVSNSVGDIIVSISAHCIPRNLLWLDELIRPLMSDGVDLSFSKQVGADYARTSEDVYLRNKCPCKSGLVKPTYFCNASSAFVRSIWEQKAFSEQLAAQEDIDFALYHSKKGRSVYFSRKSVVVHHHNDRNIELYKRIRRERLVESQIDAYSVKALCVDVLNFPRALLKDFIWIKRKKVFLKAFFGVVSYRSTLILASISALLDVSMKRD